MKPAGVADRQKTQPLKKSLSVAIVGGCGHVGLPLGITLAQHQELAVTHHVQNHIKGFVEGLDARVEKLVDGGPNGYQHHIVALEHVEGRGRVEPAAGQCRRQRPFRATFQKRHLPRNDLANPFRIDVDKRDICSRVSKSNSQGQTNVPTATMWCW